MDKAIAFYRTTFVVIVIALIFLTIALFFEFWTFTTNSSLSPQIPDAQPLVVNSGITVAPPDYQSEITSLQNRIDALDGGTERRWRCPQWNKIAYEVALGNDFKSKSQFLWKSYQDGYDFNTTWFVVRTIGKETVESIGYQSVGCTEIPSSTWPITQAPVNQ